MPIRLTLQSVCTTTGSPREWDLAGANETEIRGQLAELGGFEIEPANPDAVLIEMVGGGTARLAWNAEGLKRLKELLDYGGVFTATGPSGSDYHDFYEALELAVDPPEVFFASAYDYVIWEAAQPRESRRPDKWDVLAAHGTEFARQPLPAHIARGEPRCCYGNSMSAVLGSPDTLTYVEGIAGGKLGPGGGALHFKAHAWVTPGDSQAIDVTWAEQHIAPTYFGVRLAESRAVKAILDARSGYGVFGAQGTVYEVAVLLRTFPELT